MGKKLFINNNSNNSFKKTVLVDGDKSISIRALLLGSQAHGKTLIENIKKDQQIKKYLDNKEIIKTIYIENKLINFIIN